MSIAQPSTTALSPAIAIDPDESSPLLHHDAIDTHGHGNQDARSVPANAGWIPQKHRPVVVLCTLCILSIDVGIFMQMAPLTRILESIICRSYYRRHPELIDFDGAIPENMCKISPVQSELAMLKGWSALFDCLPSVLLAVPYGFVADKYGRKMVLLLAITGVVMGNIWILFVCRFPDVFAVQLIWLSPAFSILGGGAGVATSLILTIVADVVTESQRSTSFFRITASVLMAQLIAIPVSSILMAQNLWLPMFLAVGAMILGGLILIPLPETLSNKLDSTSASDSEDCDDREDNSPRAGLFNRLVQSGKWIISESKSVFVSPIVATLIFTFLVNSLGRSAIELLLQYASRRYHWTIAQASFLLPLRAAVQLALLLLILPYLSYILTKYMSVGAKTKDLYISRGSVALLMLGSVGIGLSPTPILMAIFLVLYALGSGFATAVRSLATSLVEPHQVGRLYAAMTTMDMVGGMIAGPSLSALYGFGLSLDGPWVGLPFLASGVHFLIVALPLWLSDLKSHSTF